MKTKINNKNLFKVIGKAKTDNGITFSVMTGEINPPKGFMIALENKQLTNKLVEPLTLANYISDNESFLKWDDYFVGLWLNKETNLWYYDISQIRLDEINAIKLGKARNQIAIWDNEYKVELRVDANNTRDIMKAIAIGQKYIYINDNFVELPTKQTSGTATQQATYIETKARELYDKYFAPTPANPLEVPITIKTGERIFLVTTYEGDKFLCNTQTAQLYIKLDLVKSIKHFWNFKFETISKIQVLNIIQ